MNKYILVVFFSTLFVSINAQNYTRAELIIDINFLQTQLFEKHSGLDTYTSLEEINNTLNQMKATLPDSMSAIQFYGHISPILSAIKDGHTMLLPPSVYLEKSNTDSLFLPLRIFNSGDKLFVELNYLPEDKIPNGSEIISINGFSAATILNTMLNGMMRDGNNDGYARWALNWWFMEYFSYYYNHPSSFEIQYINANGSIQQTIINASSKEEIFENRTKRYPNRSFTRTYDQKPGTAVVFTLDTIHSIAIIKIKDWDEDILKNTYHQKIRKTIDSCFDSIFLCNIQHLIIDIRDNQGGNMINSKHVLSYLLDTTFNLVDNYYKVSNPALDAGNSRYKKTSGEKSKFNKIRKTIFTGKVYVLTNGGSFSNSGLFASTLKRNNRALFIGEETGGSIYSLNANTKSLTLPNTQIQFELTTKRFAINESIPNAGRGLIPDYVVHPTITDLVEGRDVILEKVLDVIQGN
ncbi:MAG TPA: S41 family peptidase [Chitinophagales bacterium]|nr:S41 family peptidase [Chitinophagales bacterium]HRG86700.1 S41 family peptidase [Chitinophagales bacterium]HRH52863.1 S41 family peptidase [Chitinophagales bacterium]